MSHRESLAAKDLLDELTATLPVPSDIPPWIGQGSVIILLLIIFLILLFIK